jgi:hypothetical protein
MTDKYSGYSQEVARILRKFDNIVNAEIGKGIETPSRETYLRGMKDAQKNLIEIASSVNRDFEEMKAGRETA